MGKPIEVTNVRYTTATAEPTSGGPISKSAVFVAGVVVGAVLAGGVSCDDQADKKDKSQSVTVQTENK